MNNKTDFQKKILKSIIATVLILVVEATVLFFIIQTVSKKAAEITERKMLAISFEQETANFGNMEKDYQRIKPYLGTINNTLPDEENLFKIPGAIEDIGLKFGIKVSLSLKSQSSLPSEISGVNYVLFSASLDGNYNILRNYLKEIDYLPIFAGVDSVVIGGSSIFNNSAIQLGGKIYIKR